VNVESSSWEAWWFYAAALQHLLMLLGGVEASTHDFHCVDSVAEFASLVVIYML